MSDKSAEAFRTIGEMAATLNVRTHILRYWEEQFPMLRPLTRAGGRRLYRPEDVALLHTINRLLYQEGYTVKGARKYLQGGAAMPVEPPAVSDVSPDRSVDIAALTAVRDRLVAALSAA